MREELNNSRPGSVGLSTKCPFCDNPYQKGRGMVVERGNNTRLVYLKCEKCKGGFLNLEFSGALGIGCVGLVTDLGPEDMDGFKKNRPISSDDILDFYQYIEGNDNFIKKYDIKRN